MKTMLKEAGILFAITLLAGLLLGYVYEVTKEPRAYQEELAKQEACVAAFPEAEASGNALTFTEVLSYTVSREMAEELSETGVTIGTVYEAYGQDGALYGYIIESTSSEGYSGDITLYTGVDLSLTVCGVSILTLNETAGLGMRAPEVLVPQYTGKQVEYFTVVKTGAVAENEVDAITAATITSNAVTNAVNGGIQVATDLMGGGADE